jgi:hypothetical protein
MDEHAGYKEQSDAKEAIGCDGEGIACETGSDGGYGRSAVAQHLGVGLST